MTKKFNPFHLVSESPWPITSSFAILNLMLFMLLTLNNVTPKILLIPFTVMMMVAYMWWRDIHRESTSQGEHSNEVINGLKMGMVLFIISEIFFFLSFFWAFLFSSMAPSVELGQYWPPNQITMFDPTGIPLLNTVLLLSSGVTVTWSHHSLLKKNYSNSVTSLYLTIFLGLVFSLFQVMEYLSSPFSISDSVLGSTFFMTTGFHGLHVMIGSLFLFVSAMRVKKMSVTYTHTVGFECAAWYWHFVDVVWLFLYIIFYWWGC